VPKDQQAEDESCGDRLESVAIYVVIGFVFLVKTDALRNVRIDS
jgi:hypothetical protein